jgi:hypothetical protein
LKRNYSKRIFLKKIVVVGFFYFLNFAKYI